MAHFLGTVVASEALHAHGGVGSGKVSGTARR